MSRFQLLGGLIAIFSALAASAQPFQCDSKMFFFQDIDGVTTTPDNQLAWVDDYWTATPTWGVSCNWATNYSKNALSANPVDGHLYFIAAGRLVRVNASCDTQQICPSIPSSVFGTFDNRGRIWILSGNQLSAYDPSNCNLVKGPFTISFSTGGMVDMAYNFEDCQIYFGSSNSVVAVDTNGQSQATYSPGFNVPGSYGGVAIGSDGNFYGMVNDIPDSELVRFNIATGLSEGAIAIAIPGVNGGSHGADMASFPCDNIKAQIGVDMECDSFKANFTDESLGLINSWYWDFGDGNSSTETNPFHVYASPGTYDVTLVITPTGSSCFTVAPDTTMITILFEEVSVADTTICIGDSVLMNVLDTLAIGYSWEPAALVSDADSFMTWLKPATTTTYTATLTYPFGCKYITRTIIPEDPNAPIAGNDTSICPGESAQLFVSGSQNLWSPGATLNDSTIPNPVATPSVTTTYIVTTFDDPYCGPHTNSVTVSIFPLPTVDAGNDTIIEKGQSAQINASTSGVSYSWFPTNDLSCTTCIDPIANPLQTTTYYLTVTDANGCTSVDSVTITVVKVDLHFIVPNAFSPNGDGQNDFIAPIVRGRFEEMHFRVYNRWGELIFEAVDGISGWDGTYKNNLQPLGVYTYVVSGADLDNNGERIVQSGSIHLLR